MNSISIRRPAVWLSTILVAILSVILISYQVNATNVSSSFINFLSTESNNGPSETQADGLYNQLNANSFAPCANSSSYKGGGVNGKDGGESYLSLVAWTSGENAGAGNDRINKSNQLINLLAGQIDGGMQLEYNAEGDSEGWCMYIVRMATQVNIPITAKVVVVNQETENKSYEISQVAGLCGDAFSSKSEGAISTQGEISGFLGGLSDAVYRSKVKPNTSSIIGQGPGSQGCATLAGALSAELSAYITSTCASNPTSEICAEEGETTAPTCVVDQVGWIICPIMNFMAGIVDAAYSFVSSLLVVQPLLTTGDSAGVYNTWSVMRNIANIAFVIAFLMIIFSQLTGVGITNYGVKKLLPRIVISAILVNLSFWICAIGVDLSNILGSSARGMFDGIANSIPSGENTTVIGEGDTAGVGWVGIVALVLAGGAGIALYAGLSVLLPALIAALLAIMTVFLVLTLRQALIILLVIIAPLAFVAFLLPNTEDLFTKWRKLLITLLLMYPIIAAIFGASALSSQIVMNGARENLPVQIMGALIAILPLAITPVVMKTAGGVLNRFGGLVNNADKGPFDRMKKGAERIRKDQEGRRRIRALNGDGRVFGAGRFRRDARRTAIGKGIEGEAARAEAGYVAKQAQDVEAFQNQLAGGRRVGPGRQATGEATSQALANAINVEAKLEADAINASSVVIKNAQLTQKELRDVSQGSAQKGIDGKNSYATRAAAIKSVVANNDIRGMSELWNQSKSWTGPEGDKLRAELADSLQGSNIRPAYYGQGAIASLRLNSHSDYTTTVETAVKANAYSPEKIATGDKDELNDVAHIVAASTTLTTAEKTAISDNAKLANKDPRLKPRITKNLDEVVALGGGVVPPTAIT